MAEKKLIGDVYYPSKEIMDYANAKCESLYASAEKDPLGFWEKEAENLYWFQKWDNVLDDSNKPFFKWFTGAKTNIAYNTSRSKIVFLSHSSQYFKAFRRISFQ